MSTSFFRRRAAVIVASIMTSFTTWPASGEESTATMPFFLAGQVLNPNIITCPATNCAPSEPGVSAVWLEGKSSRGKQAEALATFGWTVDTGRGNSQKPAVFIGAAQAIGAGSIWALNTDVVRGCNPGGPNSRRGYTGSCNVTKTPGSIGIENSSIGYEMDFSNWDQDGLLGRGPFTVGIYIHNASTFASTAGMYFDGESESSGRRNAAWHNGIGFFGDKTVQDSTLLDETSSNATLNVAGRHFVAVSTASATLSYASIYAARQSACFNALLGCLRYEPMARALIYAPAGNTAPAQVALGDDGNVSAKAIRAYAAYTPPSSRSPCAVGQMSWDKKFEYRCIEANHWQRILRSEF